MSRVKGWVGLSTRALIIVASCLGCSRNGGGAFDARGYVHETFDYHVLGTAESLLGNDWQLDNFWLESVTPATFPKELETTRLKQKNAADYIADYKLDLDGDGKPDSKYRTYLYDLRWKHRKHDSVIWLRTFPIPRDLKDRDLRVLMQSYIDEVAGAGYERVQIQPGRSLVVEKRFAAIPQDRGTARIAGLDAFISTVDVVNLDQERVTPGQHRTRVRLVLIRTPFVLMLDSYGTSVPVPILMLAGYANLPDDFQGDLPGFEHLLSNIEVRGVRGVGGNSTKVPNSPAESARSTDTPGLSGAIHQN